MEIDDTSGKRSDSIGEGSTDGEWERNWSDGFSGWECRNSVFDGLPKVEKG